MTHSLTHTQPHTHNTHTHTHTHLHSDSHSHTHSHTHTHTQTHVHAHAHIKINLFMHVCKKLVYLKLSTSCRFTGFTAKDFITVTTRLQDVYKRALRNLAKDHLHKSIQDSPTGRATSYCYISLLQIMHKCMLYCL